MGVFREEIQGLAALVHQGRREKEREEERRREKNTIKVYFVYLYV
jgi:hypothetical protein|tara:strand:+ start:280 stop:414 length:135 start_codon:yes stop_codon:yes gene_type:complete